MSAIMISIITVLNEDAFENYRARAAPTIARYGSRYLARNGQVRVLEGSWRPRTMVVVELPGLEQAEAWYRSDMTCGSSSVPATLPQACERRSFRIEDLRTGVSGSESRGAANQI